MSSEEGESTEYHENDGESDDDGGVSTVTTLNSIRQLAKAIGRSPTAVAGWVRHPEWSFPAVPPWSPEDVPKMRAWARDTLRPDYSAERNNSDGFWRNWKGWPGMKIPNRAYGDKVKDALRMPPELCTPPIRAVLSGKRKLTPAEVRAFIAYVVTIHATLVDDLDWLPTWLPDHPADEIRRRIRAVLHERLAAFAQFGLSPTLPERKQMGAFSTTDEDDE